MKLLLALLALCVGSLAVAAHSAETARALPEPLPPSSPGISLEQALAATLQANPQLQGYRFRSQALEGERRSAGLRPALRLGADLENAFGSGDLAGVDGAELTLSLASTLEPVERRDARLTLVSARERQAASQQRVTTLDVLTAVAERFIALVAAQEQLKLRQEAEALARRTLAAVTQQVEAGRRGQTELLRARAALAGASLGIDQARRQIEQERLALSSLWLDATPDFTEAKADLFALPTTAELTSLQQQLQANPDLELLASEVVASQARRLHVEAEGKATIDWSAGVRRLEEQNATALVAGLSAPLGSATRNAGALATSRAEEQQAQFDRDSAQQLLAARLALSYAAHGQAVAEAEGLRDQVLPLLREAGEASAEAFRQGRHGYQELVQAQGELLDAKSRLINALARAHLTRIQIDRITGTAPVTPTTHSLPAEATP